MQSSLVPDTKNFFPIYCTPLKNFNIHITYNPSSAGYEIEILNVATGESSAMGEIYTASQAYDIASALYHTLWYRD